MPYASAQDVLDRYEGTADPEFVTTMIGDAERELRRRVPDMDDRITAGTLDTFDVRYVVVKAVRRYLRNPEGFTFEAAGDRSVNRGAATDPRTAGEIVFTDGELAAVRAPAAEGTGWGTVRTPRVGAPVPARYGPTTWFNPSGARW